MQTLYNCTSKDSCLTPCVGTSRLFCMTKATLKFKEHAIADKSIMKFTSIISRIVESIKRTNYD